MNRLALIPTVAAALTLGATAPSFADYPDRPIIYVVPYAPGSSSDVSTRTWQPYMEACLGGTIVVENHPGAGGAIGFTKIAGAEPDGYTIGNITVPNIVTAGFTADVAWKEDSFQTIGAVIGNSSTLGVRKDSPLNTLEDFIKFAKESATPVNVGVGGVGGDDHIAAIQLIEAAGIQATAIPFGESALTRAALLGDHVQTIISSNAETARFREEIKPLAVASAERNELLPDVPTFKEKGLDFIAGSSHILAAPKGVPAEIVDKWRSCLDKIVKDPKLLADLETRSMPFNYRTATEAQAYIDSNRESLTALWNKAPWIK